MSAARHTITTARAVGISGSTTPSAASLRALAALAALVPAHAAVMVGDARGIDSAAAALLPRALIFRVGQHGSALAPFRAQLATRSIACVQATQRARGVWCAFPGRPAPPTLAPSHRPAKCFAGHGSGTWSSLALALGVGLPCIVYTPAEAAPPAAWQLQPLGNGWYFAPPAALAQPSAATVQQLLLF